MPRISTLSIRRMKGATRVVCTTAYDAAFATLADAAGVDVILVGDSLGNTMLGFPSTIPVTADMIAHHTAAVARARPNALVVADVPFAETAYPFEHLLTTCVRFVQHCGADAVKIEGGVELAETVLRLTRAGIPVMGHIGLLPQRINQIGGYRRYGKNEDEVAQLVADAKAIEAAGAFSLVGEMIDHDAAGKVAASVGIPLIGIGSGADCDGQIIVSTDILGLTPGAVPSFAKKFADLGTLARNAFEAYAGEVRGGTFPEKKKPQAPASK
ncbi:MAG TPA: 3-methyl-2-oxobutanoate hydroxymethyltransferase [Opitutales bacterium]|nr:3-methyl-2-oxobutanoate hydroxymethyltransferase [Opitutales bacterium]